jgi:hypothetical protein
MPLAGSTQTVSLSCTGEPANSRCSVTPSSITLDGTHAATANVTVQTQAAMVPSLPDGRTIKELNRQLPFLVLLLALTAAVGNAQRRAVRDLCGTAMIALLFCGACGGGGSPSGTPKGTTTLVVTGTAGTQSHSQNVTLTVN